MTALRAAIGLLTRVPVVARGERPVAGAAAFGLVGAAIGCAAAFPVLLLGPAAPLAAGALAVGIAAALSGALHLDGLADTADALAAPDPQRAEEARNDPRIGAAGAVALTVAILADASLIVALIETAGVLPAAAAVVVAFAGSRAAAALAASLARGRVRAGSSGAWFAAQAGVPAAAASVATATVVALAVSIALAMPALLAGFACGLVTTALVGEWLIGRRGALDGDGIGAIVELTCGATLLFTVLALVVGVVGPGR